MNARYITEVNVQPPVLIQVLLDPFGEDMSTRCQMLNEDPPLRRMGGSIDLIDSDKVTIMELMCFLILEELK